MAGGEVIAVTLEAVPWEVKARATAMAKEAERVVTTSGAPKRCSEAQKSPERA